LRQLSLNGPPLSVSTQLSESFQLVLWPSGRLATAGWPSSRAKIIEPELVASRRQSRLVQERLSARRRMGKSDGHLAQFVVCRPKWIDQNPFSAAFVSKEELPAGRQSDDTLALIESRGLGQKL